MIRCLPTERGCCRTLPLAHLYRAFSTLKFLWILRTSQLNVIKYLYDEIMDVVFTSAKEYFGAYLPLEIGDVLHIERPSLSHMCGSSTSISTFSRCISRVVDLIVSSIRYLVYVVVYVQFSHIYNDHDSIWSGFYGSLVYSHGLISSPSPS